MQIKNFISIQAALLVLDILELTSPIVGESSHFEFVEK